MFYSMKVQQWFKTNREKNEAQISQLQKVLEDKKEEERDITCKLRSLEAENIEANWKYANSILDIETNQLVTLKATIDTV